MTLLKVVGNLQGSGITRSRIESPGAPKKKQTKHPSNLSYIDTNIPPMAEAPSFSKQARHQRTVFCRSFIGFLEGRNLGSAPVDY